VEFFQERVVGGNIRHNASRKDLSESEVKG